MKNYYILLSILSSGIGYFLYKYATNNLHPIIIACISLATYILILPLAFIFLKVDYSLNWNGVIFTILSSLFLCLGTLSFSFALRSGGQVGAMTALNSMAPIITFLLSYIFLNESASTPKIIGFIFAIISFILIGL